VRFWFKKNKNDFKENFGDDYQFYLEDWIYKEDYAFEILTKHFQTVSLKGFGIEDLKEGIIASGAILYYLSETQHNRVQHITIQSIAEDAYVWMDRFTIRIWNCTIAITQMQSRYLMWLTKRFRQWVVVCWNVGTAFKDSNKIRSRHQVVSYLQENQEVLQKNAKSN
jgi:DNA mismatch repair protein MutS